MTTPDAPPLPAKRPRRFRSRTWLTLAFLVFSLVLGIGFGGALATRAYVNSLTGSVETATIMEGGAMKVAPSGPADPAPAPDSKALRGPIDLLLLGLDTRHGWDETDSRADTIIVMHVPAAHDKAYLMSIPRDAYVPIPAYPKAGFGGTSTKANAAFTYGSRNGLGWKGGASLTATMVHELTGISFDGVVVINFDGFRDVIEELGGVRMCVDRETVSDHFIVVDGKPVYATGKRTGVTYPNSFVHKAGCRDMAGWEALDFARQRKGGPNGDYDRQRHQQQLLRAMGKKAASAGIIANPLRITSIIKAAGGALKMDTGRATVSDFLWTLRGVSGSDLVMLKTNGGTYLRGPVKGTQLIGAQSLGMFEAARRDRLDDYIAENPAAMIGTAD